MSSKWHIPRRTFLRGVGTVMALPFLEAMAPFKALSMPQATTPPRRMAFLYFPNGMNMADWTPKQAGANFELPMILEPLKPMQQDLLLLTGLMQDKARDYGDGGGDHARASATFLTGCHPKKTGGADIRAGISVDQIAAQKIGNETRLRSLELGCETLHHTNCDSGYSCAYVANLSWHSEKTPMPPEINPRQVFERLFSSRDRSENARSRAVRTRYEKSVLDFVMEDASHLKKNLGRNDQHKLDEYMASVRELERSIEQTERVATTAPDFHKPTGVPHEFTTHLRTMYDLLALAFQTDSTRISTFLVCCDGSNRSYPFIGVPEMHHELSHHDNHPEKMAKIAKINRFHMEQLAYFLQKLKNVKEGDSTLLDNSMIVCGCGISDGNAHNHDNLPVLLAGKGGGTITTGRHLKFDNAVPMTNLYLSMLDRMHTPADRIGDSTGKLEEIG